MARLLKTQVDVRRIQTQQQATVCKKKMMRCPLPGASAEWQGFKSAVKDFCMKGLRYFACPCVEHH
eukprot:3382890-Amphidinium_carterae.1